MVWTHRNPHFSWSPWHTMRQLQEQTDRLFRGVGAELQSPRNVPTNVYEDDDQWVLAARLVGYGPGDVDIQLEGNTLTLTGKVTVASDEGEEHAVRSFERRYRVPFLANVEAITASLKNGVLTLRVPRADEAKKRTIQIEG